MADHKMRLPTKPAEATPEKEPEHVTQEFGDVVAMPAIGLPIETCREVILALQPILAETLQLRDLYKKAHWQAAGCTFYMIHQLYDAHYEKQADLADMVAERIQQLGGVCVAQGVHCQRISDLKPAPAGRECVDSQLTGLLAAHGDIIGMVRPAAKLADSAGDYTTNDILVTDVLRENEKECWFLSQHLVGHKE